jgi:hypothetical protein
VPSRATVAAAVAAAVLAVLATQTVDARDKDDGGIVVQDLAYGEVLF